MRLIYLELSFIIGFAIILYFVVHPNSLHFPNSAYSETSKILNLSNEIINSTFPQIKTQNNTIYVIWSGNVGHGIDNEMQSDIFITKSENKGDSFGESINLSNNPGSSFNPQTEISSNNIYVVWEDDTLAAETSDLNSNTSILFRQSKDNASTFLPIVSLSSINADSSNPDITTTKNNNTVYVVWQDNLDESSKILFKKSMFKENTLFSDQQIISDYQGNKFEISPEIITFNDTINIVWNDFNPEEESSHILKRSSSDGGITFGQVIQLSSDSEFAINDEIINAYNNNVYIVWQGNNKEGQFDIFLSKSSDGGITFSQPINLSNDPSNSINPQLAAVQNNLFVIWNDNSTKSSNVMIKKSSDGGITFSQPINLSNTTNSDSINPQLAATTANELFVVWQEDISENNQIYFTTVYADNFSKFE